MNMKNNEKLISNFTERLNEALLKRNMTAAELSRSTGIDEGSISNYRKGRCIAGQKNLDKITRALNVSVTWLMGLDVPFGPREITEPNPKNEIINTTKYFKITSMLNKLNDTGVQKVEDYTSDLVETGRYAKIDYNRFKTAEEIMKDDHLIAKGGGKVNISKENLQKIIEKAKKDE